MCDLQAVGPCPCNPLAKAPAFRFHLSMRTQAWLQGQLDLLLEGPFGDMPRPNVIEVHFGRLARRRFGSITMTRDKSVSRITVNGLFKDETIPEQVVQATLAHELCHYVHGFSSPLPRLYKTPHAGGIIEREFRKRGLSLLSRYEKEWTRHRWAAYLRERGHLKRTPRRKKTSLTLTDQILRLFKP